MPSTYSPNLRTELIANGEQSGTWGNTTNVNLGTILDSAVAGYTNVTVSSTADFALTANNGASDQARNMIVQLSGSPGGAFNMFIPPASKFYVLRNTTSYDATVKNSTALNGTTASGGATFVLKANTTSLIFSDGTNVREALTGFTGNLSINGSLTVNGDTTLGNARISGTYTGSVVGSTTTITVTAANTYANGDYVGFIVTSGTGQSGYYGPISSVSSSTFQFTYTSATAVTAGNCVVTNDLITLNGVVSPGVVIDGSSTLPALRVTQTGTGVSLLIDDSTNPDSTPFVVDASGNVITGNTAALSTFNNSTATPRIQEIGITTNDATLGLALFSATDADSPTIDLAKAGAAAVGTYTAVASGETLGAVRFSGSDGTDFAPAASISAAADGATGAGDMPGRLVFNTVPDGSNTLTERMRINNAGNIIIGRGEGTASLTGGTVRAPSGTGTDINGADLVITAGNGTGTGGSGVIAFQTAPVSTTGSTANTMATAFVINNAANTAIGTAAATNASLLVSKNIVNATTGPGYGIYQNGTFQSSTTSGVYYYTTANVAASTTLTTLSHYFATEGTITGTVTEQHGFRTGTDLSSATANLGFYHPGVTAANITAGKTVYGFYNNQNTATGGGTAYGFYAPGTAVNYFSNLLIGGTTARATKNSTGTTAITPQQQVIGTTESASSLGVFNYSATTTVDPSIAFSKSLNATVGSFSQTTNGTQLGGISFNGVGLTSDTVFSTAAYIQATVNSATLATGSVPGQIAFGTTNVGDTAPVDRMTLDNRGVLTIGPATASGAALTTTAPAKLYVDNATYTDSATGASGTVTHGAIVSVNNSAIAATNTSVTYTNASTLYVDGAPTNGTNVTITNPYALYVAGGATYFGGSVVASNTLTATVDSATTNAVITPLEVKATSTGTPATGIGTGVNFSTETSASNVEIGAAIQAITTSVTATAEDFDLSFLTMTAGAAASEKLRIASTGLVYGKYATMSRGVVPAQAYYRLAADYSGTTGVAAQSLFGVGVPLAANTTYAFEMVFNLLKTTGATSNNISLLFDIGAGTVADIAYSLTGVFKANPTTTITTPDVLLYSQVATATQVTNSSTTSAVNLTAIVKGTLSVGTAGTWTPQYKLSAATGISFSTLTGSYVNVYPLGPSGAAINVGGWV